MSGVLSSDKIKLATIKRATQKNKKLQTILEYEDGRKKTVAFGARDMSDYTQHGNEDRKDRYLQRHKHDSRAIDTPGFWARDLLWNKETIAQSAKDI